MPARPGRRARLINAGERRSKKQTLQCLDAAAELIPPLLTMIAGAKDFPCQFLESTKYRTSDSSYR
jgi:hypothetical protein